MRLDDPEATKLEQMERERDNLIRDYNKELIAWRVKYENETAVAQAAIAALRDALEKITNLRVQKGGNR